MERRRWCAEDRFCDRVSVGGGCQSSVTARTRCGWVKSMEGCELLYGKRFPILLKGVVCKSYARPGILNVSETFSLNERAFCKMHRVPW